MKEFVTSVNIHNTDSETVEDLTVVQGHFVFDGRIRSDQAGRFTTYVNKGELTTHIETNFTVKVVKAKHIQWREMKSCTQKGTIQSELTALVMEHLKGEQNENASENTFETGPIVPTEYPEYDVETERALALEEDRPVYRPVLNDMVAKAAVKDSNDLLEIPSFLKRS
jgi:hypothetical protein